MEFLNLFFLAWALFSASAEDYPANLLRNEGRITNGTTAGENEFPFQAGLLLDDKYFCGGVLFKNNCVITAAHCVKGISSGVAYFGSNTLLNYQVKLNFSASDVRIEPSYDSRRIVGDIAIIKLSEELTSSSSIQPIELSSADTCTPGNQVTVSGWGRTSDGSQSLAILLQAANFQVIANKMCQRFYKMPVGDGSICASTAYNTSTCNGDSGGPVISTSTYTLCGVVSFGYTLGCQKGAPIGFTNVHKYVDFITKYC